MQVEISSYMTLLKYSIHNTNLTNLTKNQSDSWNKAIITHFRYNGTKFAHTVQIKYSAMEFVRNRMVYISWNINPPFKLSKIPVQSILMAINTFPVHIYDNGLHIRYHVTDLPLMRTKYVQLLNFRRDWLLLCYKNNSGRWISNTY